MAIYKVRKANKRSDSYRFERWERIAGRWTMELVVANVNIAVANTKRRQMEGTI